MKTQSKMRTLYPDFYELQKQLQFIKGGHSYSIAGEEIPSVTTILSKDKPIPKFLLMQEEFRMSMAFGTLVHECVESDILGIERPFDHTGEVYKKADMFMSWINSLGGEIVGTEEKVFDIESWYCGTVDVMLKTGDSITVIDLKTSKIQTKAKYQVAGYIDAAEFMGLPISGGLIASVNGDEIDVKPVSEKNRTKWREILLSYNNGEFDEEN